MTDIRRSFADLGQGQIHLRHAGPRDGAPLALIHQSPGSSKQLEPLMAALGARGRNCAAPDTPGNGDSAPLPNSAPEIPDLAQVAFDALTRCFDGPFDIYGSHTGASIAMEIAIAHPDRIRSLTIEGMGLYSGGLQSEVLDRYAREIRPDAEATHLMKVWHFCRDQHLFWPYYNRTAEGRLPDDDTLHDFVVEVLKAMRSYHLSYRAAFRWPKVERLPLLRVPTMVMSSPSDMLHEYSQAVADLVPGATCTVLPAWTDPAFHATTAAVLDQFLEGVPA
ncbi:alpha/beta fold hydrolase [Puniceibacterium sp. IMCC21224]|uniref:alpha/beta fold hydrolase n=1 Tax=Puniceibacterium sp. IMCC21224 TaxID=1618204 RepID=UPI00064D7AB7|nr:alpha/beta hydrolase [Puniceibacterium sp. IMCC21224]KMK64921.1 putative hydrolase or acyltransferase of alpha/beta superfamily [Puniceibacterium sp. IMCC21224]